MTTKKKDTADKRPSSSDTPLPLGLTSHEILKVVTGFQSGMAHGKSLLEQYGDLVVESIPASNPRTGNTCVLAVLEYEREGKYFGEYMLELGTPEGFVMTHWEYETGNRAEEAYARESAHKTFVTWCALIGIKAGYALTVKPSPYLGLTD